MSGWQSVRLGDVCEVLDRLRKPITKSARTAGPYPYYGATGIVDYVDGFLFDEPLVLLGEDGAKWGAGENSAFSASGRYWVNNHAHIIRPDRTKVLDDWLIYYLNMADLAPFITGLTVPKLNQERMREIPIPLPPLEEQRRIVAVLDEGFAAIATAIANAEKNGANMRELASQTLLAKLTSCSAKSRKIKDIAIVDWGNTNLTKSSYVDDGPALAVSAAGCDGRIGHAEHEAGVPVLSAIGARCGRMFFPEEPFTAIKNTITFTPISGEVDGKFLFHLLSSVTLPQRGAAQPFIAKGDINAFEVLVPDLSDQRTLVAEIDGVLAFSDRLEEINATRLQRIADLKQSLLQRAFTGEMTAASPDLVPA